MIRGNSMSGGHVIRILLACVLMGCSDTSHSLGESIKSHVGRMSLKSTSEAENAEKLCEEAGRLLVQGPSSEGRETIRLLSGYYKGIEFDERTYSSRANSLSRYFDLVRHMVDILAKNPDFSEQAWRFQLDALERINLEIERCRQEPPGGPYGNIVPSCGQFQTQKQYLSDLKAKRFKFIREGFETGSFTRYFHSLPESKRDEWLMCLEGVAHRKVVVWNPENQMIKLPVFRPEDDGEESRGGSNEQLGGGATVIMRPVKRR